MKMLNTEKSYGWIAIALHWIMALLIIGMLSLGLYMADLPKNDFKYQLFAIHKEFGVLVLMFLIVRFTWRILNTRPSLAELPVWERISSLIVHWAAYGLMLAMPMTGWLLSSAAGKPVLFFGLFYMPDLIAPNPHLSHLLAKAHEYIAYVLIATICLHVVAAFKHYLIDKDQILQRMLRP